MGVLRRIARALRGPAGAAEPRAGSGPGAEAGSGAADPEHLAEILAALRGFVAERSDGRLPAGAIDASQHVFDAGYLDSLSSLSFLAFVEERFGVEIREVDLVARFNTLASLAAHVAEERGG